MSLSKRCIKALPPQNILPLQSWILEHPLLSSSLFIALTAQIRGRDEHLFCKAAEHSGNGELTGTICSKGTGRNYVQKIQNRKRKVILAIKVIFHCGSSRCCPALEFQWSSSSHHKSAQMFYCQCPFSISLF